MVRCSGKVDLSRQISVLKKICGTSSEPWSYRTSGQPGERMYRILVRYSRAGLVAYDLKSGTQWISHVRRRNTSNHMDSTSRSSTKLGCPSLLWSLSASQAMAAPFPQLRSNALPPAHRRIPCRPAHRWLPSGIDVLVPVKHGEGAQRCLTFPSPRFIGERVGAHCEAMGG